MEAVTEYLKRFAGGSSKLRSVAEVASATGMTEQDVLASARKDRDIFVTGSVTGYLPVRKAAKP